jgi:hypothetical protein
MRAAAFLLTLLIAASAGAQTVNTQVNGLTLTNGLSTVSDAAGLTVSSNTTNLATGIGYLTDNNILTQAWNIGHTSASGTTLAGEFGGTISSQADAVYLIGTAQFKAPDSAYVASGNFSLQLILTSGLSSALSISPVNFMITDQVASLAAIYHSNVGFIQSPYFNPPDTSFFIAYLKVPLSNFGVSYEQVQGFRISNITPYWPDIGFVGLGYGGTSPIPEPSTYGLILGGLALAGAAIRRRKNSK